jgi:hypothetical protein
MNTLADAWNWYCATKQSLGRMRRLGEKHWNSSTLAHTSTRQDDAFRMLEGAEIVDETEVSLKPIDDLAVVVLFSVFESRVRDDLIERMKPQAAVIHDPILSEAANEAVRGVEEGSFFGRVLEPLKRQHRVSAELVTQVDQVRDYRNWVAHGRREAPTNNVTPLTAFTRLAEFLDALGIAVATEQNVSDPSDREV